MKDKFLQECIHKSYLFHHKPTTCHLFRVSGFLIQSYYTQNQQKKSSCIFPNRDHECHQSYRMYRELQMRAAFALLFRFLKIVLLYLLRNMCSALVLTFFLQSRVKLNVFIGKTKCFHHKKNVLNHAIYAKVITQYMLMCFQG